MGVGWSGHSDWDDTCGLLMCVSKCPSGSPGDDTPRGVLRGVRNPCWCSVEGEAPHPHLQILLQMRLGIFSLCLLARSH